MRWLTFVSCVAVLASCARSEEKAPKDTGESATIQPAAAAPISLAEVSGKWNVRSTDESGGNVVESGLTVTSDTTGWTMQVPNNRKPIPVRVIAVAGDSIITEAGPFESALRKGLQVQTRTVYRLQDGKLVGDIEARYRIKGTDTVAHRRLEGTRAP
jgi:hypothetical protein